MRMCVHALVRVATAAAAVAVADRGVLGFTLGREHEAVLHNLSIANLCVQTCVQTCV